MVLTLIVLLSFAAALPLWSASRDAHAIATRIAGETCARAGVQLLDGTVALRRLRLRRDEHGRIRWLRNYQYAYSTRGDDRAVAEISLLGGRLLWIQEP